ncbi:hypothetical protein JR316_0004120 [Psilocybe cubensis]|uniref:Uncharacterized protein n=2 Tax=Psilocybe cubensis TaxID=181762 RepID=A0A8H8CPG1_PSICU|nr:hypothetical protein JR316_0004120 [Psilocybe cubensis]KAH9484638.1 hypothetical protein JR316_0004120 [Psilocybe cubensis]
MADRTRTRVGIMVVGPEIAENPGFPDISSCTNTTHNVWAMSVDMPDSTMIEISGRSLYEPIVGGPSRDWERWRRTIFNTSSDVTAALTQREMEKDARASLNHHEGTRAPVSLGPKTRYWIVVVIARTDK